MFRKTRIDAYVQNVKGRNSVSALTSAKRNLTGILIGTSIGSITATIIAGTIVKIRNRKHRSTTRAATGAGTESEIVDRSKYSEFTQA